MNLVSAYPKSVNPGIPVNSPTPKGWSKVTYGDFLYEVQRPIQLEDEEYYQLVTVKRSRGGVVVRSMLKGVEVKTPRQFLIKEGDLLISKRQIVHGACGIVPVELGGSIVSSEYSILKSRPELNLDFFNHFTHTAYFQQTCFHSSVGVHVEKMIFKLDEWFEWDFNLPPLSEQCKIAEVLGVWDESIDLLERLIRRVRSRKQGLMQQLLTGKKRFKEFESSEWKKVSLEKIADINPRSHPNNLQFVGEFVEMASVSESGHLKNVALIDLDNSISGYTTFINGDTLVAKITPCFENGKGALIEGLQGIGFGSTEFFVLRAKLEIIPIYLYYLTRTYDFGMRGKAMMQGSGGQQRVPSDFIRQFAVKLPSLPEQEKIAAVLSAADEEISMLEKQLAAYKQQKLGLMQQLLTGRIRI
jgi:type I restriction enzyme, S subunit